MFGPKEKVNFFIEKKLVGLKGCPSFKKEVTLHHEATLNRI